MGNVDHQIVFAPLRLPCFLFIFQCGPLDLVHPVLHLPELFRQPDKFLVRPDQIRTCRHDLLNVPYGSFPLQINDSQNQNQPAHRNQERNKWFQALKKVIKQRWLPDDHPVKDKVCSSDKKHIPQRGEQSHSDTPKNHFSGEC